MNNNEEWPEGYGATGGQGYQCGDAWVKKWRVGREANRISIITDEKGVLMVARLMAEGRRLRDKTSRMGDLEFELEERTLQATDDHIRAEETQDELNAVRNRLRAEVRRLEGEVRRLSGEYSKEKDRADNLFEIYRHWAGRVSGELHIATNVFPEAGIESLARIAIVQSKEHSAQRARADALQKELDECEEEYSDVNDSLGEERKKNRRLSSGLETMGVENRILRGVVIALSKGRCGELSEMWGISLEEADDLRRDFFRSLRKEAERNE